MCLGWSAKLNFVWCRCYGYLKGESEMMTKPKCSYLSIDLDYWNKTRPEIARNFFRKMFKEIPSTCQVDVVVEHQDLLEFVVDKKLDFDELINVDFHDDLAPNADTGIMDGNWVGTVPWREKARYIWRYPHFNNLDVNNGICGRNNFDTNFNRPKYGYGSNKYGWKNVKASFGTRIDYSTVKKVGISISPKYLEFGMIDFTTCTMLLSNLHRTKSFHNGAWKWLTIIQEAKRVEDLPSWFGVWRT